MREGREGRKGREGRPLLFFEQEPTQALTTARILIVPSFLLYLEMNALEGNKILAPGNTRRNIHTFASVSGLLTQRGPWSGCVGLCFRLKRLLFMLGKRLFGFQNPISKSGPGLEPLCNREAQVGAPDLDLAILSGLQLRRGTVHCKSSSRHRYDAAMLRGPPGS